MKTPLFLTLAATLVLVGGVPFSSGVALAHSQTPAFTKEHSLTNTTILSYTITNEFNHPSTFRIEVLDHEFKPVQGWETKRPIVKLLPGSKTKVKIRFKAHGHRKLHVCSSLHTKGKGANNEKASIITRICSRLSLYGPVSPVSRE
tara:strand:+ start:341 stop:778 length:438 start_codon:yes stop_codon:yes gene_type:complete